uniref:Uncharacterized protein MANES_05G052400 n=1 Tax=Rhizophora mucronata TaxID=61149 RepID=A0A2P2Q4N8_RHIMU
MPVLIIYDQCYRWFSYQTFHNKVACAASLSIWSTSIFLLWNICCPTGSHYATFPMIIRTKRTPIQYVFKDAINFLLVRCLWRPTSPCFNMKPCWTVFICRFAPHKIIHPSKRDKCKSIHIVTPTFNFRPHKISSRKLQRWRILHRKGQNLIPSCHCQEKKTVGRKQRC